jgi:phage terminase large subunit-like protein
MIEAEEYKRRIEQYIDSVETGKRSAGRYEIRAIARYRSDLKKKNWDYHFSEEAGMQALLFFNALKHFEGEWAGQDLGLEGWQAFIVWNIFGWLKKNGKRRFTYADILVARKNGKTTLAAGIGLYMLTLDGERGAQVFSAAVDKGQAGVCWGAAKEISKASKPLRSILKHYHSSIIVESTVSYFKPLSKETKNKDGLNPHCAICDERHAWPTNAIFDVIKSGMGARSQPLVLSISTAGFDMDAPYFKDMQVLYDILDGKKSKDNQFIMIFQPDKDDDWKSPETWEKANPNYGISVKEDYFAGELEDALNKGGTTEVNFKTKNLNLWVDAPDVWISDDVIGENNFGTEEDELLGEECYAGLDLASHVDINALALYFPNHPNKPFKFLFFVPESKLDADDPNHENYKLWKKEGFLITTPGEMIDIDLMVDIILKELKKYNVKNLAFDPYKAYHGVIQGLIKGGIEEILDEYTQNIANMSEPAKEIQRLLIARSVDLMHNQVIRWMFRNVAMYKDINGNIRPDKRKSSGKIDGVVSMIDAVGGFLSLSAEQNSKEAYSAHSLRVISL